MFAYEQALRATSTSYAPWYAIPADDKPYMRATIAEIVVDAMTSIGLEYPVASDEDLAKFDDVRQELGESDADDEVVD